jgi:hypothetical protein
MLLIHSVSVIPKKIVYPRYCLVLFRRPINIIRSQNNNKVNLELCFVPLPSGGNTYRSDLNKKLPDRNKKLRYVGYQRACDSNQRACVTSIDTLQAKQLNDRLSKAANLYDGWFSRNVENLDLAPSHSRVSFSSVKGLT